MNETAVKNYIEKLVADDCQKAFNKWKKEVLIATSNIENVAPGLKARTKNFVEINKPSFFKAWDIKCQEKMYALTGTKTITLKENKARLYLETYLSNNKNCRKSADQLGVPKSTFHDWLVKNNELIIAEENKH